MVSPWDNSVDIWLQAAQKMQNQLESLLWEGVDLGYYAVDLIAYSQLCKTPFWLTVSYQGLGRGVIFVQSNRQLLIDPQ